MLLAVRTCFGEDGLKDDFALIGGSQLERLEAGWGVFRDRALASWSLHMRSFTLFHQHRQFIEFFDRFHYHDITIDNLLPLRVDRWCLVLQCFETDWRVLCAVFNLHVVIVPKQVSIVIGFGSWGRNGYLRDHDALVFTGAVAGTGSDWLWILSSFGWSVFFGQISIDNAS